MRQNVFPWDTWGVVKHWGEVNHTVVLKEGLNFVTPVRTTVEYINVKLLKFDQQAQASSKDLQTVSTIVTIQLFHWKRVQCVSKNRKGKQCDRNPSETGGGGKRKGGDSQIHG